MKIEKFHMCGNNSVYVEAFQLLPGCAPAQLRGNTVYNINYNSACGSRHDPADGDTTSVIHSGLHLEHETQLADRYI
jgi:hypothetical protein